MAVCCDVEDIGAQERLTFTLENPKPAPGGGSSTTIEGGAESIEHGRGGDIVRARQGAPEPDRPMIPVVVVVGRERSLEGRELGRDVVQDRRRGHPFLESQGVGESAAIDRPGRESLLASSQRG